MELETLLPCPFCANPDVALISDKELQHIDDCECYTMMPESWTVNCSAAGTESHPGKGCGSSGGFSETKMEAIAKWNRRSADSAGAKADG